MKKQFFSLTIIISLLFSCTKPIEKPNIVIIIADDVSWDDLGCYGNEFVKTIQQRKQLLQKKVLI